MTLGLTIVSEAVTTGVDDPAETYRARLAAAGSAVHDLRAALESATELRDGLIVECCERGETRRVVARTVGLSEGRVIGILAEN